MNKTAIVTGASHGIGRQLANRLTEEGWLVYGVGRTFDQEVLFAKVELDLLDTRALFTWLNKHMDRVDLLVNNAGCAYYGMHEEISSLQIQEMVRLNLEVPMLLCGKLIRCLRKKKGMIINISSACALHDAAHGAVYAATKAGLLSFSNSLFTENRKFGVRVCTILPDLTNTELYRHADFMPEEGSLSITAVSENIMQVIHSPAGTVMKTLEIQPQLSKIRRKKI